MTDRIDKFIKSLDKKTRQRLLEKILEIKKSPSIASNVKVLKGFKNVYRLRMGKIRVIYRVLGGKIKIIDIDYRGNIY